MRRCIFVIGTRAQLVKISPVLRLATESKLQHTVWFTGQHHESIDDLIADFDLTSSIVQPPNAKERSSIGKLLLWMPSTFYRCYSYLSGVRKWTKRRPLVIVHGDTLSTWLGAVAGRWAGGSSGKWPELRYMVGSVPRGAAAQTDFQESRLRFMSQSGGERAHVGVSGLRCR